MGEIVVALLAGLVGGFAGGLLGVGGGVIYIAAMVFLLDEPQHLAQGASLAAIVATGIVGGLTHLYRRNVDLPTVAQVVPAAVLAGFGAAFVADALDAAVLRRIFAVVVLYFAVAMIVGALRGQRAPAREGESR